MKNSTATTFFAPLIFLGLLFAGCGDDESAPRPDNNADMMVVDDMDDQPDTDMGVPDMDAVPDGGDMDSDMGEDPDEVVCPTPTPAPTSGGLCDASSADSDLVMIQAGTVLLPDAAYRDAYVVVDRATNQVTCAGCDCAEEGAGATTITCAEGVVSPALINTHEHITFSLSQPQPVEDERFDHRHDWREGIRGHTEIRRSPGSSTARESVLYVEVRNLFAATTSITGSVSNANAQGLLRNLDRSDLLEAGVTGVDVDYRTFPLGDADGTLRADGCTDYDIDSESRLSAGIYMPHVAEGIDPEARNEFLCLSSSANGGVDLIEDNTAIVHGVGLTAPDIADFAANGAKLIWSPRSNISLYGMTARIPLFKYYGIPIALGTDWSPSGSAEMLRELKCADFLNTEYFDRTLTERELWLSATLNAAVSMGAENQLGSLRAGMVADIAIFDGRTNTDYRAVIDAVPGDVNLVLRGGEPLVGDANLVEALVPSDEVSQCEELEVCGNARRVCAERDAGLTLSEIRSAVAPNAYGPIGTDGLFDDEFCDAPPLEPTCLPQRPMEFDSISVSDADGDGFEDAADNCPAIFNPARPIEEGAQADIDSDSLGGECDICPLNQGDMCEMFDPDDRDGDGVDNALDNCPSIVNPGQLDADGDNIGDACDNCPNFDNTVNDYCPATIYEVRDGTFELGDRVLIEGAVVNAIGDDEFFMQVNPDDPNYPGLANSGLQVYLANGQVSTVPAERAIVDVVGVVGDFGGALQLERVESVQATGQRDSLPKFTPVTADEVATGGTRADELQATLIRLVDVEVTNPNPDAPDNYGEFELDGALRVDDLLYEVDPPPSLNDRFTAIQGVLHFSFSNSKLLPRKESDISLGPPELVGFEPSPSFLENGTVGTPSPNLEIVLTNAPAMDLDVTLDYPGNLTGPATVTVPAGEVRAPITGIDAGTTNGPETLRATLDGTTFVSTTITIYDDTTPRTVESLTPSSTTLTVSDMATFEVTLSVPARAGDETVTITADPGLAMVPMTLTVPEGQLSAAFDITAGMNAATGVNLSASLGGTTETATIDIITAPPNCLIISEYFEGSGSNNKAIELYNCASQDLELSDFGICLISNDNTLDMTTNRGCTSVHVMAAKTLSFRDVHTVCKASSGPQGDPVDDIRNGCQETTSTMNFNGDDRLVVFLDENGDGQFDTNDTIVDALGQTDVRPAQTTWQDKVLRRCNLTQFDGATSYSTSSFFESFGVTETGDYGSPPASDVMCP